MFKAGDLGVNGVFFFFFLTGECWGEVVRKKVRKEKGGFLDLEVKVFQNGVGGAGLEVLQDRPVQC